MRLPNHLVLFVRAPRVGTVKSRLAAHIGRAGAWAFYRRTLGHMVRRFSDDARWRCWIAITPDTAIGARRLWPRRCRRLAQGAGDLGRRMGRVMAALPPGPVVIIGADIPDARRRHAAAAFRALGSHDAVFGPARDGGYWLVGLKRRPVVMDIFSGVRFSTRHALDDTLGNLAGGRTAALIDTLDDIDDGRDWERWKARPNP